MYDVPTSNNGILQSMLGICYHILIVMLFSIFRYIIMMHYNMDLYIYLIICPRSCLYVYTCIKKEFYLSIE